MVVTSIILRQLGLGLSELAAVERARWIPNPALAATASLLLLLGYVVSAALWGRIMRDLGGPALALGGALTRTEPPASRLRSSRALGWLRLCALNWVVYAVAFWVLARSLHLEGGVVPVASALAAAYVLG